MRQQLECEVAGTRRTGGWGEWRGSAAAFGPALGVRVCMFVSVSVCVCANVRGKSPVSFEPEGTEAIHTVCCSFDRRMGWTGGGVGGECG